MPLCRLKARLAHTIEAVDDRCRGRTGPDRPSVAAAAAPHPPAAERVVGLRHRRALALPALDGRHAPGRRGGEAPLSDAPPAAPPDALASARGRDDAPRRTPPRRRPRALRPLLRRELPRPLGP